MEKTGVSLPFVSAGHFLMFQDPEAVLHFFFTADLGREGEQGRHQDSHGLVHRQDRGFVFQGCAHGRLKGRVCLRHLCKLVYDTGGLSFGCLYHPFLCQGFQHFSDCAHSHMVYFAELAHGRQRAFVGQDSGLDLLL